MKPLFITGLGTDIGKTIVSAVLVEKLKADYWKPIQSGDLDNTDTQKVRRLVSNTVSVFHPETYRLSQPFSPHKSAEIDGIKIELNNISTPQTDNKLVIEGAGGLMVPLNDDVYIVDLIAKINADVIFVVKHYLGSINHALLSLEALKSRNIKVEGIIINGEPDKYSEQAIRNYTDLPILGHIPFVSELNQNVIIEMGEQLNISF